MSNRLDVFAANVPRYTSYPTAPHFHSGISETTYRGWLQELEPGSALSLYVHIPFCDTLCWFCGCNMSVVNHYGPVREYLDLLLREIAMLEGAIPRRLPVTHIHWGGGSPTILSPDDVQLLSDALRRHFDVRPSAEFAVEIDPRGFGEAMVKSFASAGLTRASIGLQDINPKVQRAINRVQTEEETRSAVQMLREEGVRSINLDLIYGLPHQTLESLEATLEFALSLDPDRLAVFGYAHVPEFKKHQALIPGEALPGTEARLEMAWRAQEFLSERGYVPIGLDHFARPGDSLAEAADKGTLSRNFQGYTVDTAPVLLGLGASSIGALPQGYVQNVPTVPLYRPMIEAGRLPIMRGVALTAEDRLRREVIERLMCDLEVDLAAIAPLGKGPSLFAEPLARLQPLMDEGLVSQSGSRITIEPEWRMAARVIASAFDAYLPQEKLRYSRSV